MFLLRNNVFIIIIAMTISSFYTLFLSLGNRDFYSAPKTCVPEIIFD